MAVVGDVYRFLATGDDTNGKYALGEAIVPPGSGPATASPSRAVLSKLKLPVSRALPSGLKAAATIQPCCCRGGPSCLPVAAFHMGDD